MKVGSCVMQAIAYLCIRVGWIFGAVAVLVVGRASFLRRIISTSCRNEWKRCCGGNRSNVLILDLHHYRSSAELKKKLKMLTSPVFKNNIWCSKWSEVTARYIFWVVSERNGWAAAELWELDMLFIINLFGNVLLSLVSQQGA